MDKHSMPSIEKFAAFLDGNLSQDEMRQMSQQAEHNVALRQLLSASIAIDDVMGEDIQLPPELADKEFELPEIEKSENNFSFDDRFADNDNLYQQRGSTVEEQLFDKIVDEIDLGKDDVGDLDDLGYDLGSDDFDVDI